MTRWTPEVDIEDLQVLRAAAEWKIERDREYLAENLAVSEQEADEVYQRIARTEEALRDTDPYRDDEPAYDAMNHGRCSRCGDLGCKCDALS